MAYCPETWPLPSQLGVGQLCTKKTRNVNIWWTILKAQRLVGPSKQLKQLIQTEHNIGKNLNWPEANQKAKNSAITSLIHYGEFITTMYIKKVNAFIIVIEYWTITHLRSSLGFPSAPAIQKDIITEILSAGGTIGRQLQLFHNRNRPSTIIIIIIIFIEEINFTDKYDGITRVARGAL